MQSLIYPLSGVFTGVILFWVITKFIRHIESEEKSSENLNFFQECVKNKTFFALTCISSAVLTYISFAEYDLTARGISALVFFYSLIILTFVDLRTFILPDLITRPLIVFGILQGWFGYFTDFYDAIYGATSGYLILWTVNTVFRIVRKKEGMGYGDFKLLAALGAWCGVWQLLFIILASSIIGLVFALISLKMKGLDRSHPVPFGPSLAVAGIISFLWGQDIIDWYTSVIY